ncbi:MAG: hypothetical protein CL605_13520 [Altibacter sp.]|nr:hypothetical protein [Altibacter sp.]
MPIVLYVYYSDRGEILKTLVYDISPEPYQKNKQRIGHCDEFTMDSLRDQIIGEPREINENELNYLLT